VKIIKELQRRNVFRVAVGYIVSTWLLAQVADLVLENIGAPDWVMQTIMLLLALGFPVVLFFSWAYEVTPEGIKRESEIDRGESVNHITGRKLDKAVLAVLVVAVAYFAYDKFILDPKRDAELLEAVSQAGTELEPANTDPDEPVSSTEIRPEVLPNSVAVLPLENLSLDPEDAFFAVGIHDELLNQLAKISDLNVIARTSVQRYAGENDMSISEIARELRVEAVMEGTVRYGGNRVRITTQLIDGSSNLHLWSETYESEFDAENIFAIESDMAMQIAAALEAKLLPAEQASIEKLPTTSTEALTLYLKARASITDLGPFMPAQESANFHRYLDEALESDPEFALAHAAKAYEYGFSIGRTFPLSDSDAISGRTTLVKTHAQTALGLDPNLGFAFGALAWPHTYGLRRAEAQAAWDQAYKLSPGDPDILVDYSYFLAATGQAKRAVAMAQRALDVAPNSAQTAAVAGFVFIFAGDYERAALIESKAITLDPAFFFSYLMLGILEATRGANEKAVEHIRFAEELSEGIPSPDVLAQIAYGYGLIGKSEDARRLFTSIENMALQFHIGAASWAMAYLAIGDEERALDHLLKASDVTQGGEGYLALTFLAGNAFSDPVLEQKMFVNARRKLGIRNDL
jgi:TolB-like protein/Tfp pilus assembly protein PilF